MPTPGRWRGRFTLWAMTTVFAAAGDTWGISGPAFLQIFLILAVGGLVLALVWRRAAMRGADVGALRPATPLEVAYLNGGASLALHTSVAGVRVAGALAGGPTAGTLATVGPMPAGFTDLDYAASTPLGTPRPSDKPH